MVNQSPSDNRQRLALIHHLWKELQAARKDPKKYETLVEQIRREADAFRQAPDPRDIEH